MDSPPNGDAPQPPPIRRPPTPPVPRTFSRPKQPPEGEQEVGTDLKLGEFNGVHSLSVSEARILVSAVFHDRKKRKPHLFVEKENITKMLDYLDEFARFRATESNEALEHVLLTHPEFVHWERSQLANLCCDSADEAKTLIPSIANKISDEDLDALLQEINKLRQFTEA